jgi:hypothetical protein
MTNLARFLLIACLGGGVLGLSACAGDTATRAAAALAITCDTYAAALEQLTPLRAAGELSDANITRIDNTNEQVTPICGTGSVLDPGEAIGTVQAAISLLTVARN